jgi:predicted PurR-regulated permease PerM
MELNKKNIRIIMSMIVVSLLIYFGLLNFGAVRQCLGYFMGIMTPFIAGGCVAFILNVPMRGIERGIAFLFSKRKNPKKPAPKAFMRISSLLITLLIFAGVIFAVVLLVAPEIGRSVNMIVARYPAFELRIENTAKDLGVRYPAVKDYIASFNISWDTINWETIGQNILNFTKTAGGSVLSSTIGVASSIVGVVFTSIIAFVFAINVLLQKDKLTVQARKVIYAFLPEKAAEKTLYVFSLTNQTFANFVSGQCRESLILGSMVMITLSIFQFPYAVLIGILIAVFSLIPMFGSFIGFCFGEFFILIVDPVKAVWFIIIFIIIQQIEGNLIYPRVVGASIGLPSIWVIIAVIVGGSLYGVIGMLVFIPMSSVLYVLFREVVNKRLKKKGISKEISDVKADP